MHTFYVWFYYVLFYLGGKKSKGWKEAGRECKTWEGGIEKRTPGIVSGKETKASRDKENWTKNIKS